MYFKLIFMVNAVGKLTGNEPVYSSELRCQISGLVCILAYWRMTILFMADLAFAITGRTQAHVPWQPQNTDKVTGDYGGHCNYWHETFRMPHCTGCFVPG